MKWLHTRIHTSMVWFDNESVRLLFDVYTHQLWTSIFDRRLLFLTFGSILAFTLFLSLCIYLTFAVQNKCVIHLKKKKRRQHQSSAPICDLHIFFKYFSTLSFPCFFDATNCKQQQHQHQNLNGYKVFKCNGTVMKNKLYNENERDKIVIVVHQMGHILYACVSFMNFSANRFFVCVLAGAHFVLQHCCVFSPIYFYLMGRVWYVRKMDMSKLRWMTTSMCKCKRSQSDLK